MVESINVMLKEFQTCLLLEFNCKTFQLQGQNFSEGKIKAAERIRVMRKQCYYLGALIYPFLTGNNLGG